MKINQASIGMLTGVLSLSFCLGVEAKTSTFLRDVSSQLSDHESIEQPFSVQRRTKHRYGPPHPHPHRRPIYPRRWKPIPPPPPWRPPPPPPRWGPPPPPPWRPPPPPPRWRPPTPPPRWRRGV